MKDVSVCLTRSRRAKNLAAILILLTLPTGLFFYGWLFRPIGETVFLTGFGCLVVAGTLFAFRKSALLQFRSTPVLIFRANGLEIPSETLLEWSIFKDAVVFTYEGNKTIGLRLRDDLDSSTRDTISETLADDLDWTVFGMPVTMPFSGMSLSGSELLDQLKKHGVTINATEKQIGFGEETELM